MKNKNEDYCMMCRMFLKKKNHKVKHNLTCVGRWQRRSTPRGRVLDDLASLSSLIRKVEIQEDFPDL